MDPIRMVTRAAQLTLITDDTGDNNCRDHIDGADAHLACPP